LVKQTPAFSYKSHPWLYKIANKIK